MVLVLAGGARNCDSPRVAADQVLLKHSRFALLCRDEHQWPAVLAFAVHIKPNILACNKQP